jgi:transcriptional regulator with XRE-family HTH domain
MRRMWSGKPASYFVGPRIAELRKQHGRLSQQELAERCEEAGASSLNRTVIANLETRRRQDISVDELLTLALVLDVSPVELFLPTEDRPVKIGKWVMPSSLIRAWVRGGRPIPSQDASFYWGHLGEPEEEPVDLLSELKRLIERSERRDRDIRRSRRTRQSSLAGRPN